MRPASGMIAALSDLIDQLVSDPQARETARLELLKLDGAPELEGIRQRLAPFASPPSMPLSEPAADALACDPWTRRARPAFLYIIYALLLWSIPMGLIAAVRPDMAAAIAQGMNAYLNGLPEALYALFGTGYLGYTAARTWGKVKGVHK